MFGAREVVLPVLFPAVIAGLPLLAAARWQRDDPERAAGDRIAPLALAAAYLSGHRLVIGWPPFPPVEASQWLVWVAIAAALTGVMLAGGGLRPPAIQAAVGVTLLVSSVMLWLRPMWRHQWAPAESVAAVGSTVLLAGALWLGLLRSARRLSPATGWLCAMTTTALAALALGLSGSALLGQLTGALAAAIGAGWVVSLTPVGRALPRAATPVPALVLAGVLTAGYFYSELPLLAAMLLAASPVATAAIPASLYRGRHRAVQVVLPAAVSLAMGAAAAWVAFASSPPLDPYY